MPVNKNKDLPILDYDLFEQYKNETGKDAIYKKDCSTFHTIRYVNWLESKINNKISLIGSLDIKKDGSMVIVKGKSVGTTESLYDTNQSKRGKPILTTAKESMKQINKLENAMKKIDTIAIKKKDKEKYNNRIMPDLAKSHTQKDYCIERSKKISIQTIFQWETIFYQYNKLMFLNSAIKSKITQSEMDDYIDHAIRSSMLIGRSIGYLVDDCIYAIQNREANKS